MGDVATAPVLDSDVLIDHLRDAGPGRELVDQLASTSGYRITAVTAFELALGRDAQHPSLRQGAGTAGDRARALARWRG